VLARESAQRRKRRWTAALLLGAVGALTLAAFARELRRPVQQSGPDALQLGSQRWWIGLALACLLLGLGALTYFGLLQR
jgi:drug/metabolite transporter (DMT)-like permease